MKKGQIYEGVIERVDFPNKGLVHVPEEDRYVIVKNGIPGQKIRFVINKFKKGNAEGRLLEVLEKSPLETREPVCSIFPACGGCMYQTMPYEEQMKMKEGQIRRLMDEAVRGDYIFEGVKASPKEFGYRNKMEFSFGDEYKDGPLSLGLHKKGSTYDVLTHIKSIVEDIPEEERSTFITLARSTSISQNSHANNDVGIIGGGIPYYEVNPDFAPKYEGTGTENSAEDALAPYRDADAYISITSKDFGSDPDQVVLDLMKASASIDPLKFFHGVLDNWYYINNLLPGAIKAAYAAEALYPELFEGYGDEVAQRFIDEGYSPLVGQTPESLCGFLTYQDYLDAGGEPA